MKASNTPLLITPSLLNSWLRIWECRKAVKEAESDTICIEDKRDLASKKAYDEFVSALNREKTPPNEYMLRGIEFEQDCYDGKTCISPIIDGGAYQISGVKRITVNGQAFVMYGRLDVLKGGTIYDIKRVSKYSVQKYLWSSQHGFYLELFPRAKQFKYLIYDGAKLHIETYYPEQCRKTSEIISEFVSYLKTKGLYETYENKWKAKGE